MFSRARLSGSPSPCYPQAARQAMAARRSGLVAGTLIPLIFLATACGGDASDGGDGAPELHASIAQDRRVIALRGSCTTSLNLRSPVTLRGAPPAGDPIPTLRGTAESDTTVSIEAGQTDKFGIEALRLEHPGGAAEPANETARARLNITDQLDTDPGLCCIGVDGGKVRVLSCAISSFNGTCFGGTGNLTSALLTNCTLSDANFGVVVASGARVCVERSLFTHLREALPLPPAQPPQDPALLTAGARGQAGVVAMGNSTLAEMEANRIEGGASGGHGAGVLGLSVTAGARAVCLGNEAVGCGRAALSVSGAGSFASVSDGLARGPGEYGALVSDRGRASMKGCSVSGFDYGAVVMDGGSHLWAQEADFAGGNKKENVFAGMAGTLHLDGRTHVGDGVVAEAAGELRVPVIGDEGGWAPSTRCEPSGGARGQGW